MKKIALYDASGNSGVLAQESTQELEEESVRNQVLSSSSSNSDQIETLPVASITTSGSNSSSNSGHANLPLNVLDGNFETSWSIKEIGSWISLGLLSISNIQSVKIAWYRGDSFDYYYDKSLSNDGIKFLLQALNQNQVYIHFS